MALSNTPLENPLNRSERAAVRNELETLAAALLADPVSYDSDIPAEEQERRCADAALQSSAAAVALAGPIIGFNEASHTRNILNALTAEIDEDNLEAQQVLRVAAAKLDAVCDGALEQRGAEYVRSIEDDLQKYGFTIQHVLGDPEPAATPAFSYTVGLSDGGHPELVMVGMGVATAHSLLDELACRVVDGKGRYRPGDRISGLFKNERLELLISACPQVLREHLHVARREGEFPEAFQVFWPDENGDLPGEPGAEAEVAAAQSFPHWG